MGIFIRKQPSRRKEGRGEGGGCELRRNANLIAEHDFCRGTLPTAVATCRDHKGARRVEIELRNDAGAVAGHNEKGSGRGTRLGTARVVVREIIQTEDVVGGADDGTIFVSMSVTSYGLRENGGGYVCVHVTRTKAGLLFFSWRPLSFSS